MQFTLPFLEVACFLVYMMCMLGYCLPEISPPKFSCAFQPPLWEIYQQQVKEWEVALTKNNTLSSNGCLDKVATLEKPPMFAFCLKPRGLESQNKGLKHRSQKRISVSGHTNSIPDQDGFHTTGKYLVYKLISLVVITLKKIMDFLLTSNCSKLRKKTQWLSIW